MSAEPWQRGEIAGPIKATVIKKPEVVAALVKRAKRPIMVVGHKAAEMDVGGEKLIDILIRIAKTANIPVVATAHTVKEFLSRGYTPAAWMPAVDIGQRLMDPEWKGLDGQGPYDLALFVGMPYYMEWVILASLKHFATHMKTVSLDKYFQPHATWSFPNLPTDVYRKQLKVVLERLGG